MTVVGTLNPWNMGYNAGMAVPILKEPPLTMRDALIPYMVAGLNMLAPTLAARQILDPRSFLVAVLLIVLGIPCSIYFRQRRYHRIVLNLVITGPLLVLTWLLVHNHPGLQFNWSNPMEAMMNRDSYDQLEGMLHIFTLLAAGRAFLLVNAADLLQTPLPSMSIFLLAVITRRAQMEHALFPMLCLLVLFISSLFIFIQEQHQQWFAIHTPRRVQQRLLVWALFTSLCCFPFIMLMGGNLRGFNMYAMASRARHGNWLARLRNPLGTQFIVTFDPTIEMGGANWPRGHQQIMTVTVPKDAPQDLLWRGSTYTTYEDGRWQALQGLPSAAMPSGKSPILKPGDGWTQQIRAGKQRITLQMPGPAGDPGLSQAITEKKWMPDDPQRVVVQKFTFDAFISGTRAPVYGAFQIAEVSGSPNNFSNVNVIRDGSIALRVGGGTKVLRPYVVTSYIKPLPSVQPELEIDPELPDRAVYLQMPGGNGIIDGYNSEFTKAIRQKAIEILASRNLSLSSKAFDKMHQFEVYLGNHYHYTLKPSPPQPGVDPILDFLYTQKQGYCNYFSGAMVMLCRSIGLPARFVTGYATGDMVENPTEANVVSYKVTSDHAHSWVEVYLPHYGWYTVDPTAGSRLAATPWGRAWDNVTELFARIKAFFIAWGTAFRQSMSARVYTIIGAALALALVVGIIRWRAERPPAFPRHPLTPGEATRTVLSAYARMHRWLEMWGVHKPDGLTAMEFEVLFHAINVPMGQPVRELTDLYVRAKYGSIPLQDADARQAISLLHQLWQVGTVEHKRLYAAEADA